MGKGNFTEDFKLDAIKQITGLCQINMFCN